MQKLWDAGLDWLTMTFPAGHPDYVRALSNVQAEMKLSSEGSEGIKPAVLQGYIGNKTRNIFAGERYDGLMIRASGRAAKDIGKLFKEKGINGKATRIDIQTTAQHATEDEIFYSEARRRIEAATTRGRGKKPLNSCAYKARGRDCGMVVGSRNSERYFRLYNKTEEQRNRIAPRLVRYEGEYKGRRAVEVWNMYQKSAQPYYLACSLMRAEFGNLGLDMNFLLDVEPVEFESSYNPKKTDRQLAWLEKYVRGTVQELVEKGKLDEVLEALGLDI